MAANMKLFDFFATKNTTGSEQGSLFLRLKELLGSLNDAEQLYITGVAGLLGGVAFSDLEISQDELDKMEQVLQEQLNLEENLLQKIVAVIKSVTTDLLGIEDYKYARMINESCNLEEKKDVIRCLLRVAAANDSISAEEDNKLGLIAQGLLLNRQDYISLRSEFREHLDILKDLPSK